MEKQIQSLELSSYLPDGWQIKLEKAGVQLVAPGCTAANVFLDGQIGNLIASAANLKKPISIVWDGCNHPFEISHRLSAVSGSPSVPDPQVPEVGSYGASRISPFAQYDAIEDFVRGQRANEKIVTVMSMGSDRFLKVNDLQIRDRAGGWNMDDWIGTDAKRLWIRSLRGTLPGGVNYYQNLIDLVTTDYYIPEFRYLIDRPNNGGLWEDFTTYHYAHDYGGVAVRIAVSTPGQSRQIEVAA